VRRTISESPLWALGAFAPSAARTIPAEPVCLRLNALQKLEKGLLADQFDWLVFSELNRIKGEPTRSHQLWLSSLQNPAISNPYVSRTTLTGTGLFRHRLHWMRISRPHGEASGRFHHRHTAPQAFPRPS